ncbi:MULTISPECIES: DUF418 domain-containing protein [unclassified Colwellia]|jgi:uncharacterized protein|uniref:DUF418 domain-containing protein n=1 Tax=unclassified Colwellia TaxID=196834 RepID=UPI0021751EA0|nr:MULTISPECIES: DUF418 domain-containing protein [unclassified Colwellia]
MMQVSQEDESVIPPPKLKPLDKHKRVDALDILRGLALVGILLMNIEWFNRAIISLGSHDTTLTGIDHAVGWLIRCFVEGKFYKLFALIFGMGFAVMLLRAKDAGRPFGAWFVRRMLVLLLIGIAHMIFLWGGDILHQYAIAGLILLAWVTYKKTEDPKAYLKLALMWLMIPLFLVSFLGSILGMVFNESKYQEIWQNELDIYTAVEQQLLINTDVILEKNDAIDSEESSAEEAILTDEELREITIAETIEQRKALQADIAEEDSAFMQNSYWQATEYRLGFLGFMLMFTPIMSLVVLIPIFILGFWLVVTEKITKHQEHHKFFSLLAKVGLCVGIPLNVASILIIQHPATAISVVLQGVGQTLFYIGQYLLSAGYLGLVVCALNKQIWKKFFAAFSPMGQMALTNYLMHSVILTSIFYGYAGGQYGEISRAPQMLIVIAIIVTQIILSKWWLNRYRFGPMEWLWRSLTYKQMQPMKL